MELTKDLLDNEIKQAERAITEQQRQLWHAEGGLHVLRQLGELLDRELHVPAE